MYQEILIDLIQLYCDLLNSVTMPKRFKFAKNEASDSLHDLKLPLSPHFLGV